MIFVEARAPTLAEYAGHTTFQPFRLLGVARFVLVQDGDLDGHTIEVNDAPDHLRNSRTGHALIHAVNVVVKGAVRFAHHTDTITLLQASRVENENQKRKKALS